MNQFPSVLKIDSGVIHKKIKFAAMMHQLGIPELPERVVVETRVIGREAAILQNLTDLVNITAGNNIANNHSAAKKHNPIPATLTNVQVSSVEFFSTPTPVLPHVTPIIKKIRNVETMTDGPNPCRERGVQTDQESFNSIGIQCNLENEYSDFEFHSTVEINTNEKEKNVDELKARFEDFVKKHTTRFENRNFECLLCGEIKPNNRLIDKHMAMHWGPEKLCFRCGIKFEHKVIFKNHNCAYKRASKKQRIKCPYYACGAQAISPEELYDHINEHCGIRPYHCKPCRKKFATFDELRTHKRFFTCSENKVKIFENLYNLPKEDTKYRKRAFVIKMSKRKRMLVKLFLFNTTRFAQYCCVCLQRCKNTFHYQMHTKRCLDRFRRRLRQKRDSKLNGSVINLTNGTNEYI